MSLPVHIRTVGEDKADQARTGRLRTVCQPLSFESLASLEELREFSLDAPTLVRLFGRATTQVLTWLGSKGRVASDAAVLGCADGIVVELLGPSNLIQPPRGIGVLATSFVSAFASLKPDCDTSSAAIILGASEESRSMAAALSRLGFKRLLIVDPDDKKADYMVQILRRRLFGFDIQAVPRATLTQVPNECSIAINLIDDSEDLFLEDVSYLNFLQKRGIWIDWTNAATARGHAEEIANAGAQILSSDLIRSWRDVLLLDAVPGLLAQAGRRPESLVEQLEMSPS